MELNFVFVLPEDHTSPSGGNLYNHFLLRALRDEGLSFETTDLHEALNHAQRGAPGVYWVDSLYLSCLDELVMKRSPGQDIFFIVHHLPSLEPTRDEQVATLSEAQEQDILGQMTGFLVTSPFTKEVLVRRKLVSKPILVVPPALCLSPSGKKTEAAGFRGLMVSNLIRRKGILEFLEEPGRRLLRGDRFGIQVAGRFDIEPCYAEACLGIEVHSFRVAILATMNYRSMRFHPQEEEDLEYVGLYERHMRRRQDFGFAMGPGCSDIMITGLEETGYEVRSGKSIWIITSAV